MNRERLIAVARGDATPDLIAASFNDPVDPVDPALVRKLFGKVLSGKPDFEVAFARDGVEALSQLHAFQPDVITLDIHMPQMDGLACLDRIMVAAACDGGR